MVAREAYRVLVDGGSFFVLTPNPTTYYDMGKRYGFLDRYFQDNYEKAYTVIDNVATGTIHGKAMYLSGISMYLHTLSELRDSFTSAGFFIDWEDSALASEPEVSGTSEGLFIGIAVVKES